SFEGLDDFLNEILHVSLRKG
ncbi:hypothetical protein TIFTF001_054446, partial [Ficus carica]